MKNENNEKLVTQSEFKKFTEGTFKQFTEGTFKQFTEVTFKQFVEERFKQFTEGTFRRFVDGAYKQFVEVTFVQFKKTTEDRLDALAKSFREFKEVDFKRVVDRLDRLTSFYLKLQNDVDEMKLNMATKQDINRILDRIDFHSGKSRVIDQEQGVQALHIKELRETSHQHELRIVALEATQ